MTANISARMRRPLAGLLWASFVLAWPGMASAVNETEPNDTWAARQSISNDIGDFVIDGSRPFADTSDDFFSFIVRSPGMLRIESSSADSGADSIIGLFSSAGTLLASDDESGAESMSAIEYTITTPGLYGLGFSGFNPLLLACTATVTQCYDTDDDFVFDAFVAGGGAGGSAGWDYRISLSGVSLVPEPHAALLLAPGLAALLWMRRRRSSRP